MKIGMLYPRDKGGNAMTTEEHAKTDLRDKLRDLMPQTTDPEADHVLGIIHQGGGFRDFRQMQLNTSNSWRPNGR